MIITRGFEGLREIGTKNVGIAELIDKAEDMEKKWRDDFVIGNQAVPVELTPNLTARYHAGSGNYIESDLTETAFTQLCQKAGVPGSYVRKCFEFGREDLAIKNFESWAHVATQDPTSLRLRVYDDVVHAALSMQYSPFDHPEILYGVDRAVGHDGRYEANEAFLSPDHMHIRFVDFNNPLKIHGDKMYSGFTVSSSNIGSGAFAIKYFLYRFACKNGIVRVQHGGVLFRQTHLKAFMENGEELFKVAIDKMHALDAIAETQISSAMSKKLSLQEMAFYLDKAQKELHIGKKGRENLETLLSTTYDPTLWGFVNSVTENSKIYTLENRVDMEQWAGNILSNAA